MSVVLIFGLALGVGFTAVGLIGFLGWRRRMRESFNVRDPRQAA